MKLIFNKDENSQISVSQEVEGKKKSFSYVDMIKNLISEKKLEEPQVDDSFSEAEKKSINDMVDFINKEVSVLDEQDPSGLPE